MTAGKLRRALAGIRPGTVLDHYTAVYGVTKGAYRAREFVQIVLVVREYGPEYLAREYAAFWGVDVRTAKMHRAHAREVYGDAWQEVALALVAAMEAKGVEAPGAILRLAPV